MGVVSAIGIAVSKLDEARRRREPAFAIPVRSCRADLAPRLLDQIERIESLRA